MEKLYLVLENGQIFEGKSFGACGEITGEIVFSTAMTGYLETIRYSRSNVAGSKAEFSNLWLHW